MVHIPDDILNDIFSRFILPEAKSKKNDPIRVCFAIEMGHWFYLDYIRPSDPSLPDCTVETFAKSCFRHMPSLLYPHKEANLVLKKWKDFKRRVPVYGAMLITPDKEQVLLVEGNSTRGCWTFPRGKIEEDEDPFKCAIREVSEETGFDISSLADQNYFIEKNLSDRRVRLYIVHDVPQKTVFYPKVRGEIANFCWFRIDELPGAPGFKKKGESFFMVNQFIREYLKGYRTGKKRNNASECERSRHRGSSFNDGDMTTQYKGRKDSFHDIPEPRHHRRDDTHRRSDYRQRDSMSRDMTSRDSMSRDMTSREAGYVSEPPTSHRPGTYTQDLSFSRHPPRTENTSRTRTRGGRSRRGNSSRLPPPPCRLADFRLDMNALVDMLPDVPKYNYVRS